MRYVLHIFFALLISQSLSDIEKMYLEKIYIKIGLKRVKKSTIQGIGLLTKLLNVLDVKPIIPINIIQFTILFSFLLILFHFLLLKNTIPKSRTMNSSYQETYLYIKGIKRIEMSSTLFKLFMCLFYIFSQNL